MKPLFALALALLLSPAWVSAQTPTPMPMPTPPVAPKITHVVKSPNGDRVDEYYWVRDDDPKAKRPEVMQYLQAENAYTEAVLAPLAGLQQQILTELRSRIVPDESTPPAYDSGWWLWTEYVAGAEHPRLMGRRGNPEAPDARAPATVLLDRAERAKGQPFYQLGAAKLSPDGRMLAWTEDTGGRRTHVLRFRDVVAARDLPDAVQGTLENIAWASDNRTVFYLRQDPVTLQSGPVHRHTLGDDAAKDPLVYDEPDKTLFVGVRRSASGRYVIVDVGGFDTTETLVVPANRPTAAVRKVLLRRDKVRHQADHWAGRWYINTNEAATNFRLVSAPDRAPDVRSLWRTLVPARDDAKLERVVLFEHAIALQERVNAERRVRLLVDGRSRPVATAAGSTVTLSANPDPRAAHLRFDVTSLIQPQATIDLHMKSDQQIVRKLRQVPGYDPKLYATERLWAPSRDGKRIPVTLAWRRDKVKADGSAPVLINGYGSYGYPLDPMFGANRVSLLDRGFVFAIAHVRGGSDLGEAWYEDGRMMNKQNTFNDFVDATDAIVKAGWAAKGKVFASGGSAGGLLMGAVANQAGERYRGMLVAVPFVDVVTTILDETIPLSINEYTQWGDPRQKAAYEYMLSYSPYDNLRARAYPAMYVTTGLWDSQVQYYEPVKYVARLRALKTDANPLLLEVDLSSGHGGASGRFAALARTAREYAFIVDLAAR